MDLLLNTTTSATPDPVYVCPSRYDNLLEVDKLAAVMNKVDSVKLVLQENVQVALANCVTLENIEKAAEDLQAQAGMFKKNATTLKKQMWWKQLRVRAGACVNRLVSLFPIPPPP